MSGIVFINDSLVIQEENTKAVVISVYLAIINIMFSYRIFVMAMAEW